MKLTLSVKETAAFLGVGENRIRVGLQRGLFKFGTAVGTESAVRKGFVKYTYHIPKHLVEEYMGVKYEDWLSDKNE